MNRRELLGVMGAASLGFGTALSSKLAAGTADAHDRDRHAGDESCQRACAECALHCNAAAQHCIEKLAAGGAMHQAALQLTLDCQEFCSVAARMLARRGPLSATACRACAEACRRCAEACERHRADAIMAMCADACRSCAQACQEMLEHHKQA